MSCPICLNSICNSKRFSTNCNHTFHDICICKWLLVNDSCPMCRRVIDNESIYRLSIMIARYIKLYLDKSNKKIQKIRKRIKRERHITNLKLGLLLRD